MDGFFRDCTTKDLERVQPVSNRLMIAFEAMQKEATKDLELRDQMIVLIASLTQLTSVVESAMKKNSTPRFVRTVKLAVKVARAFGTGNILKGQK